MRSTSNFTKPLQVNITRRSSTNNSLGIDGNSALPTAEIGFGNALPQTVLLDLGSSLTWASGPLLNSSTLQLSGQRVSVGYSGTSVTGVFAIDTVHIAGLSAPAKFGLASQDVNPELFAGLLGLSNGPEETVMSALKDAGAIDQQTATLTVPRQDELGALTIGANIAGNIKMYRSLDDHLWSITVLDVDVNNQSMKLGPRKAVVDSGNAVLAVGSEDAAAINQALNSTGMFGDSYVIPCDTKTPLVISIGDQKFSIDSRDYVGQQVACGGCISHINPAATIGFDWSLGNTFLTNVNMVIDQDSNSLGFDPNQKSMGVDGSGPVSGGSGSSGIVAGGGAGSVRSAASKAKGDPGCCMTLMLGLVCWWSFMRKR